MIKREDICYIKRKELTLHPKSERRHAVRKGLFFPDRRKGRDAESRKRILYFFNPIP